MVYYHNMNPLYMSIYMYHTVKKSISNLTTGDIWLTPLGHRLANHLIQKKNSWTYAAKM